ncbi:MAG: SH3 domain-containing protein [Anaerolineae bacterium]
MKRWHLLVWLIAFAILLPLASITSAQSEPTALVDRALAAAGEREGHPLDRISANYTWDQLVFPDSSYGCPQPGGVYTQNTVSGYKITVSPLNSGNLYDFRASMDGAVFLLCTINGIAPDSKPDASQTAVPPATVVVPPTNAAPSTATINAPILAYVGSDGNVVLRGKEVSPSATITSDADRRFEGQVFYPSATHDYGRFRWSPDGTRLVFTDVRTQQAFIVSNGQAAQLLASNVLVLMPLAWSAQGSEVAYAVPTGQNVPNTPEIVVQVQAIAGAGAAPRVVGSFSFGQGCGGGGYSPALAAYYTDAGYGGNSLALVWTNNGFVHSTNCTGVGIRLTSFDGTTVWELPNVKNLTLSPNGSLAVALSGSQGGNTGFTIDSAVLVNLETGQTTPLLQNANLHALGWSADGTTVYAVTRELASSIDGNANAALGQQLFAVWPDTFSEYKLTLWSLPASGGQPTQLATFAGYAVGNVVGEPGSNRVIVSATASELAAVQAINAGSPIDQVIRLRPVTNLWLVSPGTGTSVEMIAGDAGSPSFSSAAQFNVIPASPVLATDLIVGSKAVVNVEAEDALNLRESPSTTASIVSVLQRGDVVTVIAGPQVVNGLRWWQLRVDATGTVGWAVDQVVENGITQQTLVLQ